jgi:DNA-binding transcriptional regulator YiaG
MNQIRHIRKAVLNVNQVEFAALAEVAQGTVSKWENSELEPSRDEMARIRAAARARGLPWDDAWFFEAPPCS